MKSRPWIVVVEAADADLLKHVDVRLSDAYLEGTEGCLTEAATVVNLCRSYDYLSTGYYVSLVADARGHRVYPGVELFEDLASPYRYFRALEEAGLETIDYKIIPGKRLVLPKLIVSGSGAVEKDETAAKPRYVSVATSYVEIVSILGRTKDRRFRRACASIFRLYPYPLLKIRFYEIDERWQIGQISPTSLRRLNSNELDHLREILQERRVDLEAGPKPQRKPERIACLWDAGDPFAASDEDTIERLTRVAAARGVHVEPIGKGELARVAEFDALFIRSHTAINNHTFTFAQTAESLGIPVIDDPDSIVRCSNKVYLHELFRRSGIPTPRTRTLSRRDSTAELEELGYPMIVKLPDGSFSQAVKKVASPEELEAVAGEMFKRSPLLIVQEFTPTDFDWRVTVLDRKLLFACRYFMAAKHWQIQRSYESGYTRYGRVEAVHREQAPPTIVEIALDAASLIGDGLYGVDIKETANGPVVIEINDNPSIETGYEDQADRDRIYEDIVDAFLRRIAIGAQRQDHA